MRRRVRGFLARRLSSEEHLGLHLTVGLLLCLLLLGAFSLVAHSVAGRHGLTAFDEDLGRDLAAHRVESPALRALFVVFTFLGSMVCLTALSVLVALGLMVRRRRRLALVWLLALVVTGLLNAGLKEAFGRAPPFPDPAVTETNQSFPSGHSMGAVVTYGLLAYFLVLTLRRRRAMVAAVVLFGLLTLGVGFSRMYLGAHYFSDVVGGFMVGGAWLSACVASIESARRRARQRHEARAHRPAPPPPP